MTRRFFHEIELAYNKLSDILGYTPRTSAAAGWKCPESAVRQKEKFNFEYNSDCRGETIFTPRIDDTQYTAQVPVTLPTYDEIIGRNGIDNNNYNDFLLRQISSDKLNVYTIHAEVEGIVCADMFDQFLSLSAARNIQWVPLQQLLPKDHSVLPASRVQQINTSGREGSLCHQMPL